MSSVAGLLQSDDAIPQSIVHTQNIDCPLNSVRPIYRYCPDVVRGNCNLPSTRTCSIPRFAFSREAPLCSALPRRLRLRANHFLLSVTFPIIPLPLSLYLPCILDSRRGFSRPTPRRPAHRPSPGRIWCLLTGSSPPSRFPRRYASYSAMAVGTNGLTCGFNWQGTADAIGQAVMITARLNSLPSPHSPPRFGSTPAGRKPGRQVDEAQCSLGNTNNMYWKIGTRLKLFLFCLMQLLVLPKQFC